MKRSTLLYLHAMDISPAYRFQCQNPKLHSVETSYASIPTLDSLTNLDQKETKPPSVYDLDKKEIFSVHSSINELIHKFYACQEYQELAEVQQGRKVFLERRPHSEFFDIVEMVLHLYNIKFVIVADKIEDSALFISPIKDDEHLKRYLAVLLPEIVKLPYTLFRKFGINLFNFCDNIELKKDEYKDVYTKKVTGGTFFVQDYVYPEKVRAHLHKIICYHISQNQKNFVKEWKNLNVTGFSYNKPWEGNGKLKGFINKDATKSILDDQVETLSCLLREDAETLNRADDIIKKKVKLMTKTFASVDPTFHFVTGWSK